MFQDFAGQKLIVVGGTSGIGKEIARLVIERGGSAVLIGKREARVNTAVAELSQSGLVFGDRTDISNTSEREALIERINTKHADTTLLVNAAGVFLRELPTVTQSVHRRLPAQQKAQ